MFCRQWFRHRVRVFSLGAVLIGVGLLYGPSFVLAQRGGGGGGGVGGGAGSGTASGVSEKDELKDFHRIMAVQAAPDQKDAFAKITQLTQSALDQLQAIQNSLQKAATPSVSPESATSVQDAIEKARAGNQGFLASFSSTQKSGLKDTAKKLAKTDSELEKQTKAFQQVAGTAKSQGEQGAAAASLEKALASFQNEQLTLGKEMSILFPTGGADLTLNIPRVTNPVIIAGQKISLSAAGTVTGASPSAAGENGRNLFRLELTADLSDLQQNITAVLRSQLDRFPRCGERIEIQQATLAPAVPASLLVANLHYERWICPPGPNRESPMEVANSDAKMDFKLTAVVDPKDGLNVLAEISRVDAEGPLRSALHSGDLGASLRQQIAASMLVALQKAVDFNITLPPVAQNSARLQKAEFQDAGADQLGLVVEGQLQLSDEQRSQFIAQIKQRVSAQGTASP